MNETRVANRPLWAGYLIGAMCLLAACTAAPAVTSPVADAAGGWLTFADPAAPFTLRYPQDAHLTAGKSKQGIYTARLQFRLPEAEGYQGMLIRVEPNETGQGIETILGDLYRRYMEGEPPESLLEDAQEMLVSGQAGVRVGGLGGTPDDFTIVVPHGKQVFIVAPVHGMTGAGLDPRALDLFNQILGTLDVRP